MPRYKGIGMPKAKKKAVVQLSEAQDESSDPPGPSEPPAPPSPDTPPTQSRSVANGLVNRLA